MKKRSELLRETMGNLIREQQMYINQGNDTQAENIDDKIALVRCKIKSVEIEEALSESEMTHG